MKNRVNYPELERCIEVVKKLRDPENGCPWDLAQTHESLLKYLVEETYEFFEAVEKKVISSMEEEIGDVLLQVLLHTTIGEQEGSFNLESAAKVLADKLIRRHPHVFDKKIPNISEEEIIENWKKVKLSEKGEKKYIFDEKFLHNSALESSFKIGVQSKEVNFDWQNHIEVMAKVEEELSELKEELLESKSWEMERIEEELGDLLFSIGQLARHLNVNPERALRKSNKKFISRFNKMEDMIRRDDKDLKNLQSMELEKYWKQVKEHERT